jgi:hypothetical protein
MVVAIFFLLGADLVDKVSIFLRALKKVQQQFLFLKMVNGDLKRKTTL